VGQETVARVHFRGHVNKHLRGIHAAGPMHRPPATLHDETGQQVGDVRTAVARRSLAALRCDDFAAKSYRRLASRAVAR